MQVPSSALLWMASPHPKLECIRCSPGSGRAPCANGCFNVVYGYREDEASRVGQRGGQESDGIPTATSAQPAHLRKWIHLAGKPEGMAIYSDDDPPS